MTYGYDRQQLAAIARGEDPNPPRDQIAELHAEIDSLKHRLRVAEYERDAARTDKERAVKQLWAQLEPSRDLVKRLWALYDRKRKTLPMQALRDALDPPAETRQP